jgi:replicative DNA helicase
VVLFINDPPEKKARESQSAPAEKEVIIAKQKNGPVGIINMIFLAPYMGFEVAAPEPWDGYTTPVDEGMA